MDRTLCNLSLPQAWIEKELAEAMVVYDLSPSQALYKAAEIGTALEGNVRDSGMTEEYCRRRSQ